MGLVLALVLLCSACDWTQFMGNPALNGTNAYETTIGSTNVGQLARTFTVPLPGASNTSLFTPVVAQDVMYVGTTNGELVAASADGTTNCTGTPKVCQPLWTATFPGMQEAFTPVVSNNVVYAAFEGGGLTTGELAAFDATGTTNCSGTPKTCQPLWTAPVVAASPLNVDGGRVFVNDVVAGQVEAFDAAGTTNCSGSPIVCQPLWTGSLAGEADFVPPAVAKGMVYAPSANGATVFDAAGTTGCGGTPKVCQPRFTASITTGVTESDDTSVVTNGLLLTGSDVFDATGTTNCSGVAPARVCAPLWTLPSTNPFSNPFIADGTLYANGASSIDAYRVPGT